MGLGGPLLNLCILIMLKVFPYNPRCSSGGPMERRGSYGKKSTLGVVVWSTGGVIFIGKIIWGLDFSRTMCSTMMEQFPYPQQKIKKINNILNIELGSMHCLFHVIYKLVFLWCVCIHSIYWIRSSLKWGVSHCLVSCLSKNKILWLIDLVLYSCIIVLELILDPVEGPYKYQAF